MKSFDDEQRARQERRTVEFGEHPFEFRGDVFYVKANVRYPAIKKVSQIAENTDGAETFERIESAVLALIDERDNAHERLHEITERDEFPVTFEDLNDLLKWLLQELTSRPPTQPSASSSGPATIGTNGTEPISSEPDPALTT